MKIYIVAPGKLEADHKVCFVKYQKRCSTEIILKEIIVKETSAIKRIEKESELIKNLLAHLPSKKVILLDIKGVLLDSIQLSNIVNEGQIHAIKNLIFIIGGSYGVNDEIKAMADHKISFGYVTWPHDLMKVMLMEQIYRAENIIKNGSYHH